jgi:hypothetical protein
VLELRNSHRTLDQKDAELRDDTAMAELFDWFTELAGAGERPRRERLAVWFAANPAAMLVLAIGAAIIAAGLVVLASQPGPCRSGASNPGAQRSPAAASTAVFRGAVHLSSCQVTGNSSAQPKQAGSGLDR